MTLYWGRNDLDKNHQGAPHLCVCLDNADVINKVLWIIFPEKRQQPDRRDFIARWSTWNLTVTAIAFWNWFILFNEGVKYIISWLWPWLWLGYDLQFFNPLYRDFNMDLALENNCVYLRRNWQYQMCWRQLDDVCWHSDLDSTYILIRN